MLCIITNPSVKDFKDYLGKSSYEDLHRTTNLFILSVYKYDGDKYIGFFGNFFENKPANPMTYVQITAPNRDSAGAPIDTAKKYDEYGILIRNKSNHP